jgi:transposase-like protein
VIAKQKFDKEFKMNAVKLLQEEGLPVSQVSRDLGSNSR